MLILLSRNYADVAVTPQYVTSHDRLKEGTWLLSWLPPWVLKLACGGSFTPEYLHALVGVDSRTSPD